MNSLALRVVRSGVLLTLLPVALGAQVIENGAFERRSESDPAVPAGWNVSGQGYVAALDSTGAVDRGLSLRMEQVRAGAFGIVAQVVDASQFQGHRITLSGKIRTEDVESGYASLWLRLEGRDGQALFVDDMAGRGATGTSDWTSFRASGAVGQDVTRVIVGTLMTGSGTAWFDDLAVDAVPLSSVPPASDSAFAYLDRALDIMEANSLRAEMIDWNSFRSAAHDEARGAVSIEETHDVIGRALRRLADNHSVFVDPEAFQAFRNRSIDQATGSSGLSGQLIDGRIGHLSIPGFSGGGEDEAREFAEEIQFLIESLDRDGVCGWVVDLRSNGGGNMWPMLAGLGPILGTGTVGYFVEPDGDETPWAYDGRSARMDDEAIVTMSPPYSPRVADPPVAVLTGPRTASSGEAIVVAFRARPRARSFGGNTAGLSTANSAFELSDGAMLALTTAVFADRERVSYGSYISPDQVVDGDPVPAAVDWLSGQPMCGARASALGAGVR